MNVVQPTLLLTTDGVPLVHAKQFPTVRCQLRSPTKKDDQVEHDGIAAERIQATEEFCLEEDIALDPWLWTSWDAFHLYPVAQSLFHYLAHDTKASKKVVRERRLVATSSAQCERYSLDRVGLIESTMTTSNTYTHRTLFSCLCTVSSRLERYFVANLPSALHVVNISSYSERT